jgi:hypothetical protein
MKRLSAVLTLGVMLMLGLAACNPTGDLGLQGTPISVPTQVPATATPDASAAPSYAEVRAAIAKIWLENPAASGEERMARVADYLKTLFGKNVQDWHGWVQRVYQPGENELYRVALLMSDPFAVGVTQPTPGPDAEVPSTDFRWAG